MNCHLYFAEYCMLECRNKGKLRKDTCECNCVDNWTGEKCRMCLY